MRPILLALTIFLFLAGCQTTTKNQPFTDFNNINPHGEDGQVIAFIGEQVGLYYVPDEDWCGTDEICMDTRYNARYKVIEVLKGNYRLPELDFEVYDHGIINPFYPHKRVILYVGQYGDRLIHQKYQYDLLSPLKGGGFAVCGDPYANYDIEDVKAIGREPLTAYQFEPAIIQEISDYLPDNDYAEDDARENFLDGMRTIAPPAYEIRGSKAKCKMGVSAQQAADIWFEFQNAE